MSGGRRISVGDTNARFSWPGWETVDLIDADHLCDVRRSPLPFGDRSVAVIGCSHLVEHLPHPASAAQFFDSCCRVLGPGGLLRIATPDADLLLERYQEGDWRFFLESDGPFILDRIVRGQLPPESLLLHNRLVGWFASYSGRLDTGGGPITTRGEVDARLAEMSVHEFGRWCVGLLEPGRVLAHVNLYHFERLEAELRLAGFNRVIRSRFGDPAWSGRGSLPPDRARHRQYSLYVDALKIE